MANQSVTFYFDDNNALLAILKNSANPTSIQATTGAIWPRIRELNITPRFGRAPSKRNIADLPTRSVEIKYKSLKSDKFRMAIALRKLIERAIERISNGLPIGPPSMKNRTPVTPPWATKQDGRRKYLNKKPYPSVTKVTLPRYGHPPSP